jgi:hypothetical protein
MVGGTIMSVPVHSHANPETDSVTSSINSTEENGSTTAVLVATSGRQQPPPPLQLQQVHPTTAEQQQQQHTSMVIPSSIVLQKLNQSALGVKAHLEQLKGNTKKSLILCSEALAAATASTTLEDDGTDAAYEQLHFNNLAVVYETNNRRHLALHALAKSLRTTPRRTGTTHHHVRDDQQDAPPLSHLFGTDGTIRSDPTLSILHNAAICGLRARNYVSAYECMVTCMVRSHIFYHRPRCWLRLSEACIGIFAELKQQHGTRDHMFSTVEVDG